MQELYGEQPPPLDRELLWMQPCSFQRLHREQQPPASNPPGITSAGSRPGNEKMIREIRNSLPVKAPSAQGNINVGPESPREGPMNMAVAEEASPGTESCGNSSPEPEEPDPM
ncbi:hypothetical protein DUI87_34819 [Hirundo rustica rustica]|uniref:Uncharacterized protein n=1 Tax=Hirundo rustica rustica TaxID=333673 RepID=A0A3M0IH23_HIRRU|nr:hypothetical protein DUI87_34819 [Hirundo rustica rustica]